jgi:hypothetical protein
MTQPYGFPWMQKKPWYKRAWIACKQFVLRKIW